MNIIITKNRYLADGIMPRGCENMLWVATDGEYDLGCKVGHGSTAREAVHDLLDQMEELTGVYNLVISFGESK